MEVEAATEPKTLNRSCDDDDDDGYTDECGSNLLLLLSHSMSSRPFVCSWAELAASNEQLDVGAPSPSSSTPLEEWAMIPKGGARLAGKCIVPAFAP